TVAALEMTAAVPGNVINGPREAVSITEPSQTDAITEHWPDLWGGQASIRRLSRRPRGSNGSLRRQRSRSRQPHRRGRGRDLSVAAARLGDTLPRSSYPYGALGLARRSDP